MSLEKWRQALEGKKFRHGKDELRFSVAGAFDAAGKRPKIYLLVRDEDGFEEPFATLTHNEPRIPLEDDQIIVRYDGHHVIGAGAGMASGFFEEVDCDNTLLGPSGVWRLKGGLP